MRLTMDPLEQAGEWLRGDSLPRWSSTQPMQRLLDYSASGELRKHSTSPFPYSPEVNQRVVLWNGDITSLNVDAIVHSTNESMNERNPASDRLFARAGPGLREEISTEIKECRTGEVRVTQGYNLPARFIIHTVGPKYNVKYQTAAENTLHSCYRNILQKACELNISSLALCVVNSVRRNYPPDEGAHIAIRTVRRFLEKHHSSLETVIFAVENTDLGIYEVLLPLYFPRSLQEEENALWQLPSDVGGLYGEPVYPDRQIRIIDNPQHSLDPDDSIDLSSHMDTTISVGEHAFSQMQGDLDQQRLLGERPQSDPLGDLMVKEMQNKERYERLLRRAKTEDLSEVSGIGCLYQSGVDRFGRPVIVFVGKWFRFKEINLDKALLYLIYLLDPLVKGDYIIVYFHTLTSTANHPSLTWLREVYNVLPYKYKKNLKSFYIVHPTIWTKMMTWWFTTFMAPAIKQKVHSLPGVEYLYSVMSPDQLEIPAYITEYDMSINGLRYFQPESPT
ncbi:protein GDAP2 homolog [Schistocerca americana]|uniref:protein GDAP2 homolog n=1 Tax=Schistocerca americana TaxID=7009 RepID=UPI001F4FA669|nr:protein GDAP2 homolog [Schistocerca americana]XP_047116514.1 protein GDAP2 homolog [Schistocerca piceifrons]XP_047116515.1 protein GDAP2 homolog [Schistocerca piceifrons]XP_047116516.1 protein GDAP2 homolog [Schistocerca piceifrons]XP_049785962.1 protein GDAP2 homolog [Schistocerca cancellata]XP_049785963.1 protein GDAP2 homolog [Schistocerca cancellata]XP_049811793.1 protein GDAP2 homolog [Schistocerca nitens]XP_049811794.1 protein GDAP2 homolog [Schistocerca nitens]XP_049811795.1 prote